MKKLLLGVCLFGMMGHVSAQNNINHSTALQSEKTENASRQLAQDLQLNEHQYIKVKSIYQQRSKLLQEIEVKHSNNPEKRDQMIQKLGTETDNQLAQILNQNQFASYLELQGRGNEGVEEINESALQENMLAEENTELQETKPAKPAPPATKPSTSLSEKERRIEQQFYQFQE